MFEECDWGKSVKIRRCPATVRKNSFQVGLPNTFYLFTTRRGLRGGNSHLDESFRLRETLYLRGITCLISTLWQERNLYLQSQ